MEAREKFALEKFALFGKVELHCEDLSGGYGNAGMRPERRLSGRKEPDGLSRRTQAVWFGGAAPAFLATKR